MFLKIDQDPFRSINQIYEEVRNSTTQTMTTQVKQLFLSVFPSFRTIQSKLYRKRWELIPPNPKRMTDLKLDLFLFQYSQEETVVKGDQVLDDGRRVVLFTTNVHLKHLAKSEQVLADGKTLETNFYHLCSSDLGCVHSCGICTSSGQETRQLRCNVQYAGRVLGVSGPTAERQVFHVRYNSTQNMIKLLSH